MTYHVTGVLWRTMRRFKIVTNSYAHAMGINLWRGTVWEVDEDGKRRIMKRVYN